jgi:hypothetical protein
VLQVAVKLDLGPDGDATEADRSTRLLRNELLQLDAASVDLVGNIDAPAGTKAFGLASVGSLIVNLTAGPVLRAVVDVVKAWVARNANRSAKLVVAGETIELTGISPAQQERLIDEWLIRVTEKSHAEN